MRTLKFQDGGRVLLRHECPAPVTDAEHALVAELNRQMALCGTIVHYYDRADWRLRWRRLLVERPAYSRDVFEVVSDGHSIGAVLPAKPPRPTLRLVRS